MTLRWGAALLLCGLVLAGCGDGLESAVVAGNAARVRALLDDGADPDAVVSFRHPRFAGGKRVKRRALVAAAVFGHTEVAELLIGHGAALSHPNNAFAICPAAALGHIDIVVLLVRAGVSPNPQRACGPKGDMTPLQIAEAQGHADIARALRAAGATR